MSIYWYIISGFIGAGFTIYFFIPAYYADSGTVVFFLAGIFFAIVTIWFFTLSYCCKYRTIDDIAFVGGKLKFNCRGRTFEDTGQVFLKKPAYIFEKSPKTHEFIAIEEPVLTHMFILLKNGPWLCPIIIWEDFVQKSKMKSGESS